MARITYISNRVIDTNGIADGASIFVYQTGTTTKVNLYLDADFTIPTTNPYVVGLGGVVPTLYTNYTGAIRLFITSLSGSTQDFDPYDSPVTTSSIIDYAPATVATTTAMAALTATVGDLVYLTATGAEGMFKFTSGNLSANVSADSAKGIYVAPASASSGASGAWVRVINDIINPQWFGVLPSNSAAVNNSAWSNMITCLTSRVSTASGFRNLGHVHFPDAQTYNFNTLDFNAGTIRVSGTGTPSFFAGTTINTTTGQTAFRFQRADTSGASSTSGGSGITSDFSIVENLRFTGAFNNTIEAEAHGIHIRSHGITVRNCFIMNYEGNGIHISAGAGDGGNANSFNVHDNVMYNCRDGIFVDGSDGNAGTGRNNDVSNSRRWGLWDSSFLGNYWHGIAENCGMPAGTYTPSMVSRTGNRYAVVAGQEVGASTNAPSGTTADNTWWYYVGAGAADTVTQNIPAWVSGTVYRSGGPIRTDNNNASTRLDGWYVEVGQGPIQAVWPTLLTGGEILTGVKGISRIRHDDTGISITGDDARLNLGLTNANPMYRIDQNGIRTYAKPLQLADAFAVTSLYSMTNVGSSTVQMYSDQDLVIKYYTNSTQTFEYDKNCINLISGKVLKVNGTQVIGPRITGWNAATNTKSKATFDTTTVTLPQLAARVGQLIDDLMTHGVIGT
jgi:hypothetical protein